MKTWFLATLVWLGLIIAPVTLVPSPSPPAPASVSKATLQLPTPDFISRVTKKPFGLYVSPRHSPVSPEKFTGYHTGADAEYQDVSDNITIKTVYSGQITYSGWVNGYGGLIAQSINYLGQNYIVIYGHLAPASLIPVDTTVSAGQPIAQLGLGYSRDNDNERRHLHLAFLKGSHLNLRGYVPTKHQLSLWQNPTDMFASP